MEVIVKNKKLVFVKTLGGGGYGQSYLYQDAISGKKYVIKFFIPYNSKASRESFKEEYKNLTTISNILNETVGKRCHPYLQCFVSIIYIKTIDKNYAFFYKDLYKKAIENGLSAIKTDLYGIITLYVPGEDSFYYVTRGHNLDMYKFFDEMTNVLDFLHSREIVHRDIKPSNIIFNNEKNYYTLIDFGISCQSKCSFISGTTRFIPESIEIKKLLHQKIYFKDYIIQDIYGLGVTAYLLANHRYPYNYTFIEGATNNPYYPSNSDDPIINNMIDELILHPETFLYPNNLTSLWDSLKKLGIQKEFAYS